MPVLLQAVARLVALKRLGVLLFVLLATLCATNNASAHERLQTKTRIRNFELTEHHSYGLLPAAKQRNASGKSRYWCPNSREIHSFRWRDPSGHLAGEEWYWVARQLGPYAAPLAADIAALSLFADQVNGLGAEIFAQQDANLNAIARAAARDNEGKPNPGEPCKPENSGGGAKGPPPAKGDVAADDDGPGGFSDKEQKTAERALRTDKDFRRWFHREYKGSEGTPDGDRTNPDLSSDQVSEAYEEWLALGKGGR